MSSLHSSPHLQLPALARLGLLQARLGQPVRLQQSKRRASRRFDDDEWGFDSGLFPPGSRPAVAIGNLLVQACASNRDGVFAIYAATGEALDVATTDDDVAWTEQPELPGTVYVETRAGSAATVVGADGRGLLVVHEDGKGVYAYDIEGAEEVNRKARNTLCNELPGVLTGSSPSWLDAEIQRQIASPKPWSVAVALGLHCRFAEHSGAQATASISMLLAGLPDTELSVPSAWFAAQTPDFRAVVATSALARCHALGDVLDAMEARFVRGVAASEKLRTECATARDNIECARLMLRGTGESTELARALYAVDSAGLRLQQKGLTFGSATQPRHLAVAANDHSAWWAA